MLDHAVAGSVSTSDFARSRPHLLSALLLVSTLACNAERQRAGTLNDEPKDGSVCEPAEAAPPPPTAWCQKDVFRVYVRPVDEAQRYPLFVDSVAFLVPGCDEPVACDGILCEVPRAAAPDDKLELVGTLMGERHMALVPLEFEGYPPDEKDCTYLARLPLPLPACADRDALAVEGQITGSVDSANLRVNLLEPYVFDGDVLYERGRIRECQTDGDRYRCRALGYQRRYLLWISDGDRTIAQRDVYVGKEGCDIQAVNYDVSLDTCAIELWLPEGVDTPDVEISTSVGSIADEAPCAFPEGSRSLLRCALPADSHPGAGQLTIRSSNGFSLTKSFNVGTRCPSVLPWKLELRLPTAFPRYGVPSILLSADEMRGLGLVRAAE